MGTPGWAGEGKAQSRTETETATERERQRERERYRDRMQGTPSCLAMHLAGVDLADVMFAELCEQKATPFCNNITSARPTPGGGHAESN